VTDAKLFVLQRVPKCRHFNGVQHDCCKVGVRYSDARSEGKCLPCLLVGATEPTTCERRELMTERDYLAREAKINAALDRARDCAVRGICCVCEKPVEPTTIHGRCLYAACGHRIGQVSR